MGHLALATVGTMFAYKAKRYTASYSLHCSPSPRTPIFAPLNASDTLGHTRASATVVKCLYGPIGRSATNGEQCNE